jgi:cyclase
MKHRIIPVLLLKENYLYKGLKFRDHKYIGDPVNAVKIFNDKEVDELILLDITASVENKEPNLGILKDIASECFMPLGYGGGVKSVEMIREVLNIGLEKVIINTQAIRNPSLISSAVNYFGSSTIVGSIDAKKNILGKYNVYINSGQEKTRWHPVAWAKELERLGVGEIIINSIDQDGSRKGYDLDLVKTVASSVLVPVIASGGSSNLLHMAEACNKFGASAAAGGAQFVFHGKFNAVLITYPTQYEIEQAFCSM